jgi:hypothetical protein
MTLTYTESVGGKRTVRLARDWTGADVAAAALIRRADVVVKHVSPAFTDTASFRVVGRDFEFPQDMLLVLDGFGTLHLAGMGGLVLARPRETLRRWPAGTATVVIGEGRGVFRPLTITDSSHTVTVAAQFMGAAQRAALALIERLTAR